MQLQVNDLEVTYGRGTSSVHAVRGLLFSIGPGETVALVGESGCGKSTTAAVVAGLRRPSHGNVVLDGTVVSDRRRSRDVRRQIQMVFQHSDQALDPRWTVQRSIEEPLRNLTDLDRDAIRKRTLEVLEQVGLDASFLERRPRTLSGGQAQRAAIARALACHPELVVLDEPTASLDQSVRAIQLRLLTRMQREHGLSYLLITHDISSVDLIAERIVVMYRGIAVETGPAKQVLAAPQHPYTRALIASVPIADPRRRMALLPIDGEATGVADSDSGCAFAHRCHHVTSMCTSGRPDLTPTTDGRSVACVRLEAIA